MIAIVPAVLVILIYGESATGKMLIFSQVILSLQLGFAIIPLIHFVSDTSKMKGFEISKITQIASWTVALIIVSLNAKLVFDEIKTSLQSSNHPIILWLTVVPIVIGFLFLLLYIVLKPFITKAKHEIQSHLPHNFELNFSQTESYDKRKIAITVDFTDFETKEQEYARDIWLTLYRMNGINFADLLRMKC